LSKVYLALALTLALVTNSLAIYSMVRILGRYRSLRERSGIERSMRKAYVSRKKREIASSRIKKIQSAVFKLSLYQFFIPLAVFMASILIYTLIASAIKIPGDPLVLYLDRPCIAPIPIQLPEPSGKTCAMQTSWIFFLIFVLYLPLYTHYAKRYLSYEA